MLHKSYLKLTAILVVVTLLTVGAAAAAFGYLPDAFQPKGAMYVAAV
jgi:hypothetical protein